MASSDHHPSRSSAPSVHYQQQPQYVAPQAPRRWHKRVAQRLERWIFLYNVTTGLYMLDWWERCIFNAVFLLFFAVAGYNSGHYLQRIAAGLLAWAWWGNRRKRPSAMAEPLDDELGFVRSARNEQNSRLSGLGYVVRIAYDKHSLMNSHSQHRG